MAVNSLRFYLILVLAVCAASFLFHAAGIFNLLPWRIVYSDVVGFFDITKMPGFPYLQKNIEYPVITGIFIHLAGLLGKTQLFYYIVSAALLILLVIFSTYFLFQMAGSARRDKLLPYWIFAPSMLVFSLYNWDFIALFFVIVAFYCVYKNKDLWAAFFLALGFASKFYPILYVIPLLLKQNNIKDIFKIIGVFLAVAIIINMPFALANFDGWYYFFNLNSVRTASFDSIWTTVRFLFPFMDNVGRINYLSLFLFLIFYAILIWRFRKESFLKLCAIATIVFLLFNKVFSPQYVLWLLPFFVLLPFHKKSWFYTFEFSNLITLFITLSWFFAGKSMIYFYWSIPFIFLRHISLIAILFGILKINTLYKKFI